MDANRAVVNAFARPGKGQGKGMIRGKGAKGGKGGAQLGGADGLNFAERPRGKGFGKGFGKGGKGGKGKGGKGGFAASSQRNRGAADVKPKIINFQVRVGPRAHRWCPC